MSPFLLLYQNGRDIAFFVLSLDTEWGCELPKGSCQEEPIK